MEKKRFILLYLAVITVLSLRGQDSREIQKGTTSEVLIPKEKVYLHLNSTFFLSGEYLYYAVYCINSKTGKLSELSKISYIELVNEKRQAIFKHKILIDKGVGQGDYFIPVSIPSGNYKLIAYTRLMKNDIIDNVFQNDITIINPYQSDQSSLIAKDSVSSGYVEQELKISKNKVLEKPNYSTVTNPIFSLELSDSVFYRREKVSIVLKKLRKEIGDGDYSISVRKIDTIPTIKKFPWTVNKSNYFKVSKEEMIWDDQFIIPELRGELVEGKLFPLDTLIKDLENHKVVLSIPGKSYELKIANTNKEGHFYFNLETEYEGEEAFIQILGPHRNSLRAQLKPGMNWDYNSLSFTSFYLRPEMEKMILNRSVENQIRNNYFSVKKDTIKIKNIRSPFDALKSEEFILDEYTRFPTVRETLVEIVNNVWLNFDDRLEKNFFKIRPYYNNTYQGVSNPLVIVDGLVIQNHEKIIEYPASKIKRINVIRDRYVLANEIFNGVLEINTFNGDFYKDMVDSYLQKISLFKPLAEKKYFRQQYNDLLKPETDRIPDYRNQLFWEPKITIKKEITTFDFYTSDNPGKYEIQFLGFTNEGNLVHLRQIITVQ